MEKNSVYKSSKYINTQNFNLNRYCIYFHINLLKNQIFYVGIGNKDRPYTKINRSQYWYNIVNKYGYIIDVFKKDLTWKEACNLEKYWIDKIGRKDLGKGPLVNLTDGGEGAYGRVHSATTKSKISNSHKGIKHSVETKEKLCRINTGKKLSKEIKEKISKSNTGKIMSYEAKRKTAEANSIPVIQMTLDNNLIQEWISMSLASRQLNIHVNSISLCCIGKFKWKYKQLRTLI